MGDNENREVEYYQSVLNNIEKLIKDNYFKSKEELNNYFINLKNNGIPEDILTEDKKLAYLNMFDEYHPIEDTGLDMQNYKAVGLENTNIIVSTKNDELLKNNNSNEKLPEEFAQVQNEITATSTDKLANADEVYDHLKDNVKEEIKLIPLTEAINANINDLEILQKIKFFLSNQHINPYSYKVNIDTGIFYNQETKEVFEVRKNEQTGTYEIYKGSEVVYSNQNKEETNGELQAAQIGDEYTKELDSPEKEMSYENVKVKRLIKPPANNNAAFAKSTFLILASIILSILLAVVILFIKK